MGWLVLERRVDQCITIGKDIEVMVVEIGMDAVKLAIQAPKSIPICRDDAVDKTPGNFLNAQRGGTGSTERQA